MSDRGANVGVEQRRGERVEYDGQVTIELQPGTLVGAGENISDQGVYLRAGEQIPVRVRLGTDGELRAGTLVRVESIGDGSVGIAIRFAEPATNPPA